MVVLLQFIPYPLYSNLCKDQKWLNWIPSFEFLKCTSFIDIGKTLSGDAYILVYTRHGKNVCLHGAIEVNVCFKVILMPNIHFRLQQLYCEEQGTFTD